VVASFQLAFDPCWKQPLGFASVVHFELCALHRFALPPFRHLEMRRLLLGVFVPSGANFGTFRFRTVVTLAVVAIPFPLAWLLLFLWGVPVRSLSKVATMFLTASGFAIS
jgi:hypothetical protein